MASDTQMSPSFLFTQILHCNFTPGMDMVNVVDLSERTEEGELSHPLDMRYYNKMISLLPYESVTHVSVLNCMLEQVGIVDIVDKSKILIQISTAILSKLELAINDFKFLQYVIFEVFIKSYILSLLLSIYIACAIFTVKASTPFTTNKVCEDQQPKKEEPKSTDIADDPVKRQLGEMIQGLPLTLLQQSVSH